jgi:putative heme-binding domain-containing protein
VLGALMAQDRVGSPAPGATRPASDEWELMFRTLARGVRRAGGLLPIDPMMRSPGAILVVRLLQRARSRVQGLHTSEPDLLGAIAMLSSIDPEGSRDVLLTLLAPRQPLSVQVAAVQAMAEGRSASLADLLLPRMRAFEPAVRATAVRTLLSRDDWTRALLQAIQTNAAPGISPTSIEPSDRAPMVKHSDPEIARLAQTLFGRVVPGSRAPVIADYASTLRTRGDAGRGAKVFERDCKGCHKVGDRGFALGPDLTGSPSSDPAALLANILDPNASVLPAYVQYVVVDQVGRTYSGIIAAETATSLTLRRGDGAEDTILRAQVAEMTSTGLSLMPEGIEKTIAKPEMADLIAFLRAAHRGGEGQGPDADDRSRPLDIGTLPGLIEPDE